MKVNKNICYGNGQLLDCFLPDNEMTGVFIFFHGGGLEGGSKDDASFFAEYLTARRIGVVSADYRMYPAASYPDFIEDAAKAVAWAMNEFDTNIFIGGSSAGAYLSMMLCFDKKYLAKHDIDSDKISGYIFNAGQPTVHFNVLRERGLDNRRVLIDEAAPLFHVKEAAYPPMLMIVSDNDIECRLEQMMFLKATLKHFNGDNSQATMRTVQNSNHCQYDFQSDSNGNNILGTFIYEFVSKIR